MTLASIGAILLGIGLALPAAFYPMVFALSFLLGVAEPLRAAAIQRLAADEVRAQAASAASACDKALLIVGLPAAGMMGDAGGASGRRPVPPLKAAR